MRPSSILTGIGASLTGEEYHRTVSPPQTLKADPLFKTLRAIRTSPKTAEGPTMFALKKETAESMSESQRYAALHLHEAMMDL
mmetsp:Transcript_3249/g.4709  ORF Transcript_3249/g.4709 Transcript_3249/m.4709 type:complete len:83 (+) Transcript_3249:946-1194(+)